MNFRGVPRAAGRGSRAGHQPSKGIAQPDAWRPRRSTHWGPKRMEAWRLFRRIDCPTSGGFGAEAGSSSSRAFGLRPLVFLPCRAPNSLDEHMTNWL